MILCFNTMTEECLYKLMKDLGYISVNKNTEVNSVKYTFSKGFDNRLKNQHDVTKEKFHIFCDVKLNEEFEFTYITNRCSYVLKSGWISPLTNDDLFVRNEIAFAYYSFQLSNNNPF